jgi:hypothetical protein
MSSVTQRIKAIKQPRGGYINPRTLTVTEMNGTPLHNIKENVTPGIVGTVVDYMTRIIIGTPIKKAFGVSFCGANLIHRVPEATKFAAQIRGIDDASITWACRLANFDAVYRAGCGLPGYLYPLPEPETINPDANTCDNIRIMVQHALEFFKEYGPVTADGITFTGGYTPTVDSGDGDFMTADTVWDFKTNKTKPTKAHTLQICMYWLMGLHSDHAKQYEVVTRLGLFNPRLSEVFTIDVANLNHVMLHEIEVEIIGYSSSEAIF